MDVVWWLVVIAAALIVLAVGFALVRARQRSGSVKVVPPGRSGSELDSGRGLETNR